MNETIGSRLIRDNHTTPICTVDGGKIVAKTLPGWSGRACFILQCKGERPVTLISVADDYDVSDIRSLMDEVILTECVQEWFV